MVPAVVLIFNSRLALNSVLEITDICPKVTKMGFIAGHRIDYNGVGVEKPAAHTQQNLTQVFPTPPGLHHANSRLETFSKCVFVIKNIK